MRFARSEIAKPRKIERPWFLQHSAIRARGQRVQIGERLAADAAIVEHYEFEIRPGGMRIEAFHASSQQVDAIARGHDDAGSAPGGERWRRRRFLQGRRRGARQQYAANVANSRCRRIEAAGFDEPGFHGEWLVGVPAGGKYRTPIRLQPRRDASQALFVERIVVGVKRVEAWKSARVAGEQGQRVGFELVAGRQRQDVVVVIDSVDFPCDRDRPVRPDLVREHALQALRGAVVRGLNAKPGNARRLLVRCVERRLERTGALPPPTLVVGQRRCPERSPGLQAGEPIPTAPTAPDVSSGSKDPRLSDVKERSARRNDVPALDPKSETPFGQSWRDPNFARVLGQPSDPDRAAEHGARQYFVVNAIVAADTTKQGAVQRVEKPGGVDNANPASRAWRRRAP